MNIQLNDGVYWQQKTACFGLQRPSSGFDNFLATRERILCAPFSRTFLAYLFIRFACISYGRFIAIHCKFKLSMYIQEPLVIGRRGCVQGEIYTRK